MKRVEKKAWMLDILKVEEKDEQKVGKKDETMVEKKDGLKVARMVDMWVGLMDWRTELMMAELKVGKTVVLSEGRKGEQKVETLVELMAVKLAE